MTSDSIDVNVWRVLCMVSVQVSWLGQAGRERVTTLIIYHNYTGILPLKSLKCMQPYNKTVMKGNLDICTTHGPGPTCHAYIPVAFHNYIVCGSDS